MQIAWGLDPDLGDMYYCNKKRITRNVLGPSPVLILLIFDFTSHCELLKVCIMPCTHDLKTAQKILLSDRSYDKQIVSIELSRADHDISSKFFFRTMPDHMIYV